MLENKTAEAGDVVPSDQSEARMQALHALQQEHSEKLPAFQAIYDNIKKMTSGAHPQQAERLSGMYTTIAARYRVSFNYNVF